jgi:hypothetical protein
MLDGIVTLPVTGFNYRELIMKDAFQSYKTLLVGAMVVIGAAAMPAKMVANGAAEILAKVEMVEKQVHDEFFLPLFDDKNKTAPSVLVHHLFKILNDNYVIFAGRFQQKNLSVDEFIKTWEEIVRRCKNRKKQAFGPEDFKNLLEKFKPALPEQTKNYFKARFKEEWQMVPPITRRIMCEPVV